MKKTDNEVFLDRDGTTFETLVNYLRNERKVFPEFVDKNSENSFYKELLYWGIDSHNNAFFREYLRKFDMSTTQAIDLNASLLSPQNMRGTLNSTINASPVITHDITMMKRIDEKSV